MQPVSNNCYKTCRFNRDKGRLSFSKEFRLLVIFIWKRWERSQLVDCDCLKKLQRRGVPHSLAGFSPLRDFSNSSTLPAFVLYIVGEGASLAKGLIWKRFHLAEAGSDFSLHLCLHLSGSLLLMLCSLGFGHWLLRFLSVVLLWFCLHIKVYLFALLTLR